MRNTSLRCSSLWGHSAHHVHLCVADGGGGNRRYVTCYAGPGLPIQRESKPQRAFARIFDGVGFGGGNVAKLSSRRRALQVHAAELRRIAMHSGSVAASAAWIRFDRLWASQVVYLAQRLAATPEADGSTSMLDNTLVYWGVESGTEHNHSPRDQAWSRNAAPCLAC